MKKKTRNKLIVSFIILAVLIFVYFAFIQESVFPGEPSGNDIILKNQKGETNLFFEGDTINPVVIPQGAVDGIFGYMIFVNDKLFAISGGQTYSPHYSICGTESTSQEYWVGACGSWQHAFKDLLHCTSDMSCNYPGFNTMPNRLEAGNNQEVEIRVTYHRNDEVRLSGGFSRFKINVAPLPCVASSGQLLVAEVFGSGATINKNSLRYSSGFAKTCSATPSLVADKFTLTYYQDLSINTKLNNNQDYVVPNNRAVTIFYLIDNKPEFNLPAVCEVYNIESQRCESLNEVGFVTTCTDGTFNPDDLTCSVFPGKRYLCEPGQTLNLADLTCDELLPVTIKQNYTIINDCEDKGGFYDSTTNICKFSPKEEIYCKQGFSLVGDSCKKEGGNEDVPINEVIVTEYKIPIWIYFAIGFIVILLIILLIKLLKRRR